MARPKINQIANLQTELTSTSDSANNRVLKTGDTMTGQLNISNGGLLVTGTANITGNSFFNTRIIINGNTAEPAEVLKAYGVANVTGRLYAQDLELNLSAGSDGFGAVARLKSPTREFKITPYYNSEGTNNGTWLEAKNVSGGAYSRVTISSSDLILDARGNVGINTTSPSTPLEVMANGSSGLGITIRSMPDEFGSLRFRSNNGATIFGELAADYGGSPIYLSSAGAISLKTNSSDRIYITATGNVGIGNTNPQRPLVVAGVIESTSGGVRFPDGTTQASAATGAPSQNLVSGTTVTAIKDNHYILTNASATTVTLPAAPANGDVVWVTVVNNRVDNVIARNGKLLQGLSENMTLNNQYASVQLRFINDTYGWRLL